MVAYQRLFLGPTYGCPRPAEALGLAPQAADFAATAAALDLAAGCGAGGSWASMGNRMETRQEVGLDYAHETIVVISTTGLYIYIYIYIYCETQPVHMCAQR